MLVKLPIVKLPIGHLTGNFEVAFAVYELRWCLCSAQFPAYVKVKRASLHGNSHRYGKVPEHVEEAQQEAKSFGKSSCKWILPISFRELISSQHHRAKHHSMTYTAVTARSWWSSTDNTIHKAYLILLFWDYIKMRHHWNSVSKALGWGVEFTR